MEHSVLRPHGNIIIASPNGEVQMDTLCCVHCNGHWVVQRGSGRKRGWCALCNGPTCGPSCSKSCVPREQVLENIEQGRPLDYRPIRILVPRTVE